jgi:hypothetical protein
VTSRHLVLAAAAIVALGLGSFGLIYALTSPPGSAPLDPAQAAVQGAAGAGAGPLGAAFQAGPGAGGLDTTPTGQWVPPQMPQQELLPPPAKGSWDETPVVARPTSMGSLGLAVVRELEELQPGVASCFDEDVQARHGQQGHTTMDYAPADDAGSTVLVLQLETQHEAVRIADAPVEARGGASDGLIACAQAALRGRKLAVPGARAGQRYRLRYTVAP